MESKNDDVHGKYPSLLPPSASSEERVAWMGRQIELYELALQSIHDAVVVTDADGRVTFVNAAAEQLFARSRREMIDGRVFDWFRELEPIAGAGPVAERVGRGEAVQQCRVQVLRPNDGVVSALLSVTPMVTGGRIVRVIGLFRDQTELERVNEDLRLALQRAKELARIDELTGLLNSRAYHERLESASDLARRRNESLGVVMIDANGLKQINDTYTYDHGDTVIKQIAARLKLALFNTDTIARLHGDEFAVILPMTSKLMAPRDQMTRIMEKLSLVLTFALPLVMKTEGDGSVMISVSVCMGAVVRTGTQIPDPSGLLDLATHALHDAKGRFREARAKKKSPTLRVYTVDAE